MHLGLSLGANGRSATTDLSCLANPLGNTRDKRSTNGLGVWQIKEACSWWIGWRMDEGKRCTLFIICLTVSISRGACLFYLPHTLTVCRSLAACVANGFARQPGSFVAFRPVRCTITIFSSGGGAPLQYMYPPNILHQISLERSSLFSHAPRRL